MKSCAEIHAPTLYTTGAYICPMKITKEDGDQLWVWIVKEFDGDTFKDGDVHNPIEYSDTQEGLLQSE